MIEIVEQGDLSPEEQKLATKPEEFCALERERVLGLQARAGRGKTSGVDLAGRAD